jgi:hypothetical protein
MNLPDSAKSLRTMHATSVASFPFIIFPSGDMSLLKALANDLVMMANILKDLENSQSFLGSWIRVL